MKQLNAKAYIITANDLQDGHVLYWNTNEKWVHRFDTATLFKSKEVAQNDFDKAKDGIQNNIVVDVYLIEGSDSDSLLLPKREREKIRAQGPTVTPQFGKQQDLGVIKFDGQAVKVQ